jgi:hypothetical protein
MSPFVGSGPMPTLNQTVSVHCTASLASGVKCWSTKVTLSRICQCDSDRRWTGSGPAGVFLCHRPGAGLSCRTVSIWIMVRAHVASQVIRAWDEGVMTMRVGETATLVCTGDVGACRPCGFIRGPIWLMCVLRDQHVRGLNGFLRLSDYSTCVRRRPRLPVLGHRVQRDLDLRD